MEVIKIYLDKLLCIKEEREANESTHDLIILYLSIIKGVINESDEEFTKINSQNEVFDDFLLWYLIEYHEDTMNDDIWMNYGKELRGDDSDNKIYKKYMKDWINDSVVDFADFEEDYNDMLSFAQKLFQELHRFFNR